MKLTPNKYFLFSLLIVSFAGMAKESPPPPAAAPTPPGYPIDSELIFLLLAGVAFAFFFLRKKISLPQKR